MLDMEHIWYNRLLVGTATFSAIPDDERHYREKVKALGIADVKRGAMPIDQYEMIFKEEYPLDGE